MFQHITTLTDFFLEEKRHTQDVTGGLTLLLTQIENAAKIIGSHVKRTGLADILGQTGKKNIFQEDVQKLDSFSNDLLVKTLLASKHVYAVASEELEKPIYARAEGAKYIVYLDPLDGSSNIDTNNSIGTIFSIYHKEHGLLQNGEKQIAAGYIIYGTSVMFVYTSGNGVYGFTLDPAIGSFILSHPNIQIPKRGKIYSINEASTSLFFQNVQDYLRDIKKNASYKARYSGTFVADMHRILIKGGIFLYPNDSKNPHGKLRLMYEINPLAFIIKQAGGVSFSGDKKSLEITPKDIHQQAAVVIGSEENVKEFLGFKKI